MALELTFTGDDGFPVDPFVLGTDDHHLLLTATERMKLPLLCRLGDYYADVEFAVDDLGALAFELRRLEASPEAPPALRDVARRLRMVVESAAAAGKPLLAVAD